MKINKPPTVGPELLVKDRAAVIASLLEWLCDRIEEEAGVRSPPRWALNRRTGDVSFAFQPGGLLATADSERIKKIAKKMWLHLRKSFPNVFYGARYKAFCKHWRGEATAEKLSKLDERDFAKHFQAQLEPDRLVDK